MLFGSGLVGGEGLHGVDIAAVAFIQDSPPEGIGYDWAGGVAPWIALLVFGFIVFGFSRSCLKRK